MFGYSKDRKSPGWDYSIDDSEYDAPGNATLVGNNSSSPLSHATDDDDSCRSQNQRSNWPVHPSNQHSSGDHIFDTVKTYVSADIYHSRMTPEFVYECVNRVKEAAEQGCYEALCALAMMHCRTEWGIFSLSDACKIKKRIASISATGAYESALWLMSHGTNLDEAKELLVNARNAGLSLADGALIALTVIQFDAGSIKADDPEMVDIGPRLQAAADTGDSVSLYELGRACYLGRFGFSKNPVTAHRLKNMAGAAKIVYGPAHAYVGETTNDELKLSLSAEAGVVHGQYLYGKLLADAPNRSSDHAVWWLKRAYGKGSQDAGAELAVRALDLPKHGTCSSCIHSCYYQSPAQIMQLALNASEAGVAAGKLALALCYVHGVGVPVNKLKGALLMINLAENNFTYAKAQYLAGKYFANGVGVQKDKASAIKMFERAEKE